MDKLLTKMRSKLERNKDSGNSEESSPLLDEIRKNALVENDGRKNEEGTKHKLKSAPKEGRRGVGWQEHSSGLVLLKPVEGQTHSGAFHDYQKSLREGVLNRDMQGDKRNIRSKTPDEELFPLPGDKKSVNQENK
jgi:hypothetical protein